MPDERGAHPGQGPAGSGHDRDAGPEKLQEQAEDAWRRERDGTSGSRVGAPVALSLALQLGVNGERVIRKLAQRRTEHSWTRGIVGPVVTWAYPPGSQGSCQALQTAET